MTTRRHLLKLTESTIRQIEYVLPKLKYSTYIKEVTKWLENFEESEAFIALDFLFYLEYITTSELQNRLEEQLIAIEKNFGNTANYLFCSYAKYPKSNDLVLYLLSKCPTFKKFALENRAKIVNPLESSNLQEVDTVIYVDDFIGSGNSFTEWYKEKEILKKIHQKSILHERQAILAAIVMEEGKELLQIKFPDIKIYAELRSKAFCENRSPFNLTNNREQLRMIASKYGKLISKNPLGYDNSQSLVAFEYGTPNNSLPIIWSESNWHPIFPRFGNSRIKKASAIKSEAAFFIGIMNKLNIKFENNINVNIKGEEVKLSKRDDHSILVYLILRDKHFSNLSICQIIGITIRELDKICEKALMKKLIDKKGDLNMNGIEFLKILKRNKNVFQFRGENNIPDYDDKNIFVPKSFGKVT